MATMSKELEIPEELADEIQRESDRTGKSWTATAGELLDEAVRMRRAPGIVFTDGPVGRRATVAGSGLDVWEIIRTWQQDVGQNYEELRTVYDWLPELQLRAALRYYELYPKEIDEWLQLEESWTLDRVYREFPFMRPPWRE